jgi:hypothetical protein
MGAGLDGGRESHCTVGGFVETGGVAGSGVQATSAASTSRQRRIGTSEKNDYLESANEYRETYTRQGDMQTVAYLAGRRSIHHTQIWAELDVLQEETVEDVHIGTTRIHGVDGGECRAGIVGVELGAHLDGRGVHPHIQARR